MYLHINITDQVKIRKNAILTTHYNVYFYLQFKTLTFRFTYTFIFFNNPFLYFVIRRKDPFLDAKLRILRWSNTCAASVSRRSVLFVNTVST
jgi:hypothetical protein